MRPHFALSALLLLAAPSCDKAKELLGKVKPPATAKAVTPSNSGAADVRDLDAAAFPAFIATPGRLMVVDFHAEWCGPCKVLGPVLEQVAGEFPGRVSLGKFDVEKDGEFAQKEGVSAIPDVRFYREGKLVHKFVGGTGAEEIRALFQQHTEGLQIAAMNKTSPDEPASTPAAPAIQPMKKDWLPPGVERR